MTDIHKTTTTTTYTLNGNSWKTTARSSLYLHCGSSSFDCDSESDRISEQKYKWRSTSVLNVKRAHYCSDGATKKVSLTTSTSTIHKTTHKLEGANRRINKKHQIQFHFPVCLIRPQLPHSRKFNFNTRENWYFFSLFLSFFPPVMPIYFQPCTFFSFESHNFA